MWIIKKKNVATKTTFSSRFVETLVLAVLLYYSGKLLYVGTKFCEILCNKQLSNVISVLTIIVAVHSKVHMAWTYLSDLKQGRNSFISCFQFSCSCLVS